MLGGGASATVALVNDEAGAKTFVPLVVCAPTSAPVKVTCTSPDGSEMTPTAAPPS